ncbi:hypothetical protein C7B76_07320 [filamentous cyanobacterium CCP2]|nr:hypothetical protein C7B76_07320 [filamentous cyanobacterium CCP2]
MVYLLTGHARSLPLHIESQLQNVSYKLQPYSLPGFGTGTDRVVTGSAIDPILSIEESDNRSPLALTSSKFVQQHT